MEDSWKEVFKPYDKRVLIVPNYTYFGKKKNINSDSFVLVMKSFLENSKYDNFQFIIPYPDKYIPTDFGKYPNVKLVNMGRLFSFPPLMRINFPARFFQKLLGEEKIDIIWSHLPEWTNQVLVARRYSTVTQPVYGYCHWWEIPDNGAYQHNTFITNVQGMLKMKTCGVNSQWVKNKVLERASEIFNTETIAKLDTIIQPWYLGCDAWQDSEIDKKTILFNHRDDAYTGSEWFFNEMDKLYEIRQDFTVLTSISSIKRPYIKSVRHTDRGEYLKNIGRAHIGVGCFTKYSAWSMSTTDGLSRNVPYILPKELCYEEMVGKDYPLMYQGKQEFMKILVDVLDGIIERPNTKEIAENLYWENNLKNWKLE